MQEFTGNWDTGPLDVNPKSNIDADWLFTPGASTVKGDVVGHGTCMASKVCGKRSGVAKQATIIPVVLATDEEDDFSIDSMLSAVLLVEADIRARRSREPPQTPSALEKRTVMMMAINVEIDEADYQIYVELLAVAIQAIMNLGVIVAVSAGNHAYEYGEGYIADTYPAALAVSRLPSLIRVGAVDQDGLPPSWAQQGDVYACGVGVLCARQNSFSFKEDGEGASAATAAFAGLVAYNMGRSSVPYNFGDDITQYQNIVKEYHVGGLGSWARPGSYERTVWNGLDGSASTYCPLSLRKRDVNVNDTCDEPSSTSGAAPSSISSAAPSSTVSTAPAVQTPEHFEIIIYYSQQTGCAKGSCEQTYYIFDEFASMVSSICSDQLYQLAQSPASTLSIDFELITGTGDLYFTYSRASDQVGEVSGAGLSTPAKCSAAPSPTPSQVCKLTKRTVYPDNQPVTETYYEWATCIWDRS